MQKTLLTVLCEDTWNWGFTFCSVKFNQDGTGTLLAGVEFWLWIAASITWKAEDPKVLDRIVEDTDSSQIINHVFDIEITLHKGIPEFEFPIPDHFHDKVNEAVLKDDAFQPKKFKMRLQQGRLFERPGGWFKSRLVFNVSPYPPKEEWKTIPESLPTDENAIWNVTNFVTSNAGTDDVGFIAGLWWKAQDKISGQ